MALEKVEGQRRRKQRVRKKVRGTAERPRLSVYRSSKNMYAQIIDDHQGKTITCATTLSSDFNGKKNKANVNGAKELGMIIAKKALALNIKDVIFDRGGYRYHGRVQALAEGAREAGLKF
ncbi:MAG: 50S ribosomal protein L18 [Deltaproteobacteria bacterium RIFCSPLOWO2_02_FULL_50_16]|nr:MAG: 50S ribosomal protein L18 [Deltaproteobacteria bacterium GWA2_50_8]OGQ26920.1 MAG: 50S ribosomal protein L18 [Deltaproteobacteria bacterium RIFCSPHIGHO2_02_FULL_50_15]OGQ56182.1 MAG: 50S ribosomal protein L18 [Deltaproteobacteria bacterium RIFCSPLOWO2_02_FULL_50_16]OGQ67039.1 MAG: 50S ribosomal protein L18 [Deltaproteobacteria bacterium RIFCSPLOWO2_12_FULL_50_11]